jgi:hypothetical protein
VLAAGRGQPGNVTLAPPPLRRCVVDRFALLAAGELRGADLAGEAPVALRVAGEHQQMGALRVGDTALRGGQVQGELGAEHRRHADRPGRLGEAHRAVAAVVVGQRDRLQAEPARLLGQLLGVARAVEEAEVGVRVQLGVRRLPRPSGRAGDVRRSLARPGRRVLGARRRGGRWRIGHPVGEPPLELRPAHRRVVPSHDDEYRTPVRYSSTAALIVVDRRGLYRPR